ncbi:MULTISPECIES: hypothetical protein [unclassified Chryseobacterium]|uniref:hypothetical protein n=1 Tax=unclassified Chryseobacterium TaxID=2593645 RepID=UPI003015E374
MKPKLQHRDAMDYSFKAKQALDEGDFDASLELYKTAAKLESEVADFYFDKPDLEPTRSILVRSAAFLNLKAGQIEEAQKFIFFGLTNSKDEEVKEQLYDALEILVSLKNINPFGQTKEYTYLSILRQNSTHYTIEPTKLEFGHSVTLEMIKDFTDNYLKSLKAYALTKVRRLVKFRDDSISELQKEIDRIINPVITNSSYGSFRFSIANDWMKRNDEEKEIVNLKSNIVKNFHNEIFINPLGEQEITEIKEEFSEEEINEIFRPLAKIKSNNSGYSIGVYDTDSFSKKYIPKIVNKQKKELLTTKTLSQEDIGELVTTIAHKRVSEKGKVSKKTIRSEEFKKYETTFKLKEIVPKDKPSVLLSEEILIDMLFDSNIGFTFSFDDFKISYTDIEYQKALDGFNNSFYSKIISLIKKTDLNTEENDDLKIISRYIGNLDALN